MRPISIEPHRTQVRPVIIHNMSDDYKKNGKHENKLKLTNKYGVATG